MCKEKYFKLYNEHSDLFKSYFGMDAKEYWGMYKNHYEDDISYEKLSIKYNCAATKIRNILNRVEEFLDAPDEKMWEKDYSIDDLCGEIWMPNAFARGYYSLSRAANLIFHEAVYLYQHGMKQQIPRSRIIAISPQYKNVERKKALFDELYKFRIYIKDKGDIKIFDQIEEHKGGIYFEFTEETINYINPFYMFFIKEFKEL